MNHEDAAPEKGIELKPCPFCGGDAKLEGEQAGQDCVSYVFCLRCDVEGETWRSDNWVFSKNKAIEAWNARADLAAPEQSAGEVADSEQLAQMFHETYERLAPSFGYETRKSSAKPWADVPENNKRLMIAVCREIQAATCSSQPTGDRAKALEALKRVSQGIHDLYIDDVKCPETDDYAIIVNFLSSPPSVDKSVVDALRYYAENDRKRGYIDTLAQKALALLGGKVKP